LALDKEETSERVLAVAERLIEAGGAQNLKARTLADEAGIAVGSVYNLFGDLDGLHRSVNIRLLDRLGAAGAAAMAELSERKVTDPRARLLALARAYLRFVAHHPGRWAALLAFNRRGAGQAAADGYEARLDQLFAIIGSVLSDSRFGLDERRRLVTARTLWSSVHGIVTSGYASSGPRQGEAIWEQIELLVDVFIAGLERSDQARPKAKKLL
jgi:AcrR family transcriptional regulator